MLKQVQHDVPFLICVIIFPIFEQSYFMKKIIIPLVLFALLILFCFIALYTDGTGGGGDSMMHYMFA